MTRFCNSYENTRNDYNKLLERLLVIKYNLMINFIKILTYFWYIKVKNYYHLQKSIKKFINSDWV